METRILPVTEGNLKLVADLASKFGMPRSVGWLKRILFDPTVCDLTNDGMRGHIAVDETGVGVSVSCYFYLPIYFRRSRMLATSGCILASFPKYGDSLICVREENTKTQCRCCVHSSNDIANERSAKISKILSRLEEAPLLTRECRFAFTGFSGRFFYRLKRLGRIAKPLTNLGWKLAFPFVLIENLIRVFLRSKYGYRLVRRMSIDKMPFGDFWERFLEKNEGLATSRDPDRLAWLFNDSLAAGTVQLITAEKNGRIQGYTIVRRMPDTFNPGLAFHEHLVCDICAVGNDEKCLKALVGAIVYLTARDGGVRVHFYGALPGQERWLNSIFKFYNLEDHPTFMYKVKDLEIAHSLEAGKGWFFGPFDGERCMGYGGYVDL